MKTTNGKRNFLPKKNVIIITFSLFFCISATNKSIAQSMKPFYQGDETLIVYSEVPQLTAPFISDKYEIEVKSAATNNQWEKCVTHSTHNMANELPNVPKTTDGSIMATTIQAYQKFTRGWSHAFANVEMSENGPVDVRITLINGFKVQGKDISKISVKPAQKVFKTSFSGNQIFFTIYNPCQIVIDINGQMDDFNKAIDQTNTDQDNLAITYTTHTVSFFANPVMTKPASSGSLRTKYVEPGSDYQALRSLDPNSYDLMYFKPGVHDLGIDFKIKTNKKYFIPGDAVVFGTFNNLDPNSNSNWDAETPGTNVKIFGYGIISGHKITHPDWVLTKLENDNKKDKKFKSIVILKGSGSEVNGISIINPAGHSVNLETDNNVLKDNAVRWAKVVSWRANGDGIGSAKIVEDCFIRSADDGTYMKGDRRRLTMWKDANAAFFHMGYDNKLLDLTVEDIDIIYNRTRGVSGGGVFTQRQEGTAQCIVTRNVLFKNIRIHDPKSNMMVFNFNAGPAGESFSGYKFDGVDIKVDNTNFLTPAVKQILLGNSLALWKDIDFKNVTLGGRPLVWTDFNTNDYRSNVTITTSRRSLNVSVANGGGTVSGGETNIENYTTRTVIATPSGTNTFKYWTSNNKVVSLESAYTFTITSNTDLVAHYNTSLSSKGLINENLNDKMEVYPNPVKDILNIENCKNAKLEIYNSLGMLVLKTDLASNSEVINMRSLPIGSYIVRIINGKKVSSKKLIKN